VAKLAWRVKLVAELQPGVMTVTKEARIERDEEADLAELGLRLEEAKQLTVALPAQIVPAQLTVLSECRRSCVACGSTLASKSHYRVRFRSLFGDGGCSSASARAAAGQRALPSLIRSSG
jgi:hypothetical protein